MHLLFLQFARQKYLCVKVRYLLSVRYLAIGIRISSFLALYCQLIAFTFTSICKASFFLLLCSSKTILYLAVGVSSHYHGHYFPIWKLKHPKTHLFFVFCPFFFLGGKTVFFTWHLKFGIMYLTYAFEVVELVDYSVKAKLQMQTISIYMKLILKKELRYKNSQSNPPLSKVASTIVKEHNFRFQQQLFIYKKQAHELSCLNNWDLA